MPESDTSEEPLTEERECEEGAMGGEPEGGGRLRRWDGEDVRRCIARSRQLKSASLDLALLGTGESSCEGEGTIHVSGA